MTNAINLGRYKSKSIVRQHPSHVAYVCPSILISSAINTHLSAISSYKHWATQPSQPRTWLDKMPTLLGNLHLTLAICMKQAQQWLEQMFSQVSRCLFFTPFSSCSWRNTQRGQTLTNLFTSFISTFDQTLLDQTGPTAACQRE